MKSFIAISTTGDGPMSWAGGVVDREVEDNRRRFLQKHGATQDQTILVRSSYERDGFTDYKSVGMNEAGDGLARPSAIISDGLATTEPGLTLFLPLADCVGTVLYDQAKQVIMLSHFGRHNLEQDGSQLSVEYLAETYGSRPGDLIVHLSPAASGKYYPLYKFDGKSLHEVAKGQLMVAGVLADNITIDGRDTFTNPDFYSHSAFLAGRKLSDGRHAMICKIV